MNRNPFAHCPSCGRPGPEFHGEKHLLCPHCGFEFFQNVAAAVGAMIRRDDGAILWVERARDPGRGLLDLPGGFVDPGESLEEALCRECREELDVEIVSSSYFASNPNRYLYKGVEYRTADAFFFATMKGFLHFNPEEIAGIRWARPAELRAEDLAFESLRALLSRLREGTADGFGLPSIP